MENNKFLRAIRLLQNFLRFLSRPALDHDFRIGVELNRIFALRVQDAEETFLPPIKREIRHGRGDPNVDSDISRGRFVPEFARRRTAGCEQRRLVPVRDSCG